MSLRAPKPCCGKVVWWPHAGKAGREGPGPSVGHGDEPQVWVCSRKGNEWEDESDFQNDELQFLEDDDKV